MLSAGLINLLKDRQTDNVIVADDDDAEFLNIINELNTHTAAVAPHSGHVLDTGDTITGTLTLDQNSNNVALSIDGEETTANGVNIELDVLTTGTGFRLYSNSADASARNLAAIINDNAASTLAVNLFVDQDADSRCILIDSEATTEHIFDIDGPVLTTGYMLQCNDADAFTTGGFFNLVSNSADVSARNLAFIHNDNAAATGAVCLNLRNDAANSAALTIAATNRIYLDGGGNTFIYESAADIIDFFSNGSLCLRTSGSGTYIYDNLVVSATKRIYLDGGSDTYIYESAANNIDFVTGGGVRCSITTASVYFQSAATANSTNCQIAADGQITHPVSSLKYKKDVVDLEFDSSVVYNLRPVSFSYKKDDSRSFGLIAEEVEEHIPLLVYHNSDGTPESLHYDYLSVLLLSEMKKLKARIEILEAS